MKYITSSVILILMISGCADRAPIVDSSVQMPQYEVSKSVGSFSSAPSPMTTAQVQLQTEQYAYKKENGFKNVKSSPLSTFSIDVDTASYTNIKRMIEKQDTMPPIGAVRIEEMINSFEYRYPQPKKDALHPFTISTEVMPTPWNKKNRLMLVGLQAKKIAKEKLPASNFVALVDVSGSMQDEIPLVKQSLKLLAKQLRNKDYLTIVSYAGFINVVLDPTNGDKYQTISDAIDTLTSGGSTNGEQGIEVAYALAKKHFLKDGNNRIIMFTDGDFNVGNTAESSMVELVEKEAKSGIYLSIAGFKGWGYNDSAMEKMTNHGNGNYSFIGDILDAKKVFSKEMTGTLYTLGKDVKLQVEFNPKEVESYRLIGYENRMLEAEDFNDDKKDAGEIGIGHSVTALYELVMTGDDVNSTAKVDTLKYQEAKQTAKASSGELATVKMRYKKPDGDKSALLSQTVKRTAKATNNIEFASSVAGFGMLLTNSNFSKNLSYSDIVTQAKEAKGKDENGEHAEFIRLVEKAEAITSLNEEH